MGSIWTDEKLAELRRLCEEGGHTNAAIAGQLGPEFTANAVIGQRFRLGLSNLDQSPRPMTAPAVRVRRDRFDLMRLGWREPPAPDYPPPAEGEPDLRPNVRPVSLFKLDSPSAPFLCRAIVEGARDEFGVPMACGARTDGRSWCPYHRALFMGRSTVPQARQAMPTAV